MRRTFTTIAAVSAVTLSLSAQTGSTRPSVVLVPARVFDGDTMHEGWAVRVRGDRIEAVGPAAGVSPAGVPSIQLPDATLVPGLIEGHSHVLLHPYNEASWNDQVLTESQGVRVARATTHLRRTLEAGFTTIRDLGTEGAGYADVELKAAVDQGSFPAPACSSSLAPSWRPAAMGRRAFRCSGACLKVPRKPTATPLIRVVRDQIGHGADWIKVYADYRWGPDGDHSAHVLSPRSCG